jgi:dethiobiotin synthetase
MIRFVTGTDTGVGKTICSAVLARRARENGARVRYVKPVQTGATPGHSSDADFVARFAGVETFELISLDEPLAPAVAAARAGVLIDIDDLVGRTRSLEEGCDLLLAEGAGGLLAPLTTRWSMADLAHRLSADLVLVARPGLGTLNHVALTIEAATQRGLRVQSLMLSGWPARPGTVEATNLELLRARGLPVETVPFLEGADVDRGLFPTQAVNA